MTMKKIAIIFIAVISVMGCSLDRKPLNGPSTVGFPSSEDEAVAGIYAATRLWHRTMAI